jgi:cellulose synthase operon protein C
MARSIDAALALDPKNALALRALASMFVNLGQLRRAEPHLVTLADDLDDVAAAFMLSEVLLVTDRESEAIARLSVLAGDRRQFAEAKLRLATIDFVAGRHDAGYAHLEELLKQQPRMAKALALRGRFRLEQGQADAALADLQQAVTTDNEYEAGHFWLAQALLQRRRASDARTALTAALRLNPNYVPAQVEMSRLLLAAREFEPAVTMAQEAVRNAPAHVDARLALVQALVGARRLDEAERALREVSRQGGKDPRVALLEGQVRLARRDPKAAEERFAAALAARPGSYEALGGLVASRLAAGNVEGARSAADDAVGKAPTDARSLVVAARVYGQTRDFVAAESLLKRAIDADPSMLEAYSMLGQLYVSQNRLEDALREFDRLAGLQPSAVGPRTVVGVLHHMANRREDAKKAYEAVLRIDPSAVVAANNLAWMKVEDNDNLDVALQLAQAAKVRAPEAPEVSDTIGLIYYRRNLFAFSVAAYEDAVKYAPKNPEYHYRLGLALTKNNEAARAREAFTKALALSQSFPGAADAKSQLAALP